MTLSFLQHLNCQKVTDDERCYRIDVTRQAILSVLKVQQIFLFGSAVSNKRFVAESDIDCLVILDDDEDAKRWWKSYGKIRRQLNWSLDLICLTETVFQAQKDCGGIAYIASHEGVQIYP